MQLRNFRGKQLQVKKRQTHHQSLEKDQNKRPVVIRDALHNNISSQQI